MSIRWIEYKGIRVLYTDWRHKTPKQLNSLLQEYTEVLQSLDEGDVHRIANMEGVPLSEDIVNIGKQLGKDIFSKRTGKSIVLGITGIRKFYFKIYKFAAGYDLEAKDSLDDALEYIYQSVSEKTNKELA